MQASVVPQELNRIAGVDKTCNFVKVGYIADQETWKQTFYATTKGFLVIDA
jgi:hypothetical protein